MTFIIDSARWGQHLDCGAFADALAPLLGGTVTEREEGKYGRATIEIAQPGDMPALHVRISPDNAGHTFRAKVSGGFDHKLQAKLNGLEVPDYPRIGLDPERPLDKIAGDIKKRVVNASAEPHALLHERLGKAAAAVASLAGHIARLRETHPQVQISDSVDGRTAALRYYAPNAGPYLTGTLDSDGGLRVDRISNIHGPRVDLLLQALLAVV